MRLLERISHGEYRLTSEYVDNVPAYAVLSHTWGKDEDEVTFKDMKESSGISKVGYEKIRFCGEQAAANGLRYFWIDTCCIDKTNNVELAEALNSMFRWYRDAARCYVYLSDVSTVANSSAKSINQSFRESRWFTRGWTLQELLAPRSVHFFSCEGKPIGDKLSLRQTIYETTGIPILALQGAPLYDFSIDERFSWAVDRETTRGEDKAYSLLGIFDVFLPLIYGEGEEHAFRRLRDAVTRSADLPAMGHHQISNPESAPTKIGHQVLPFARNIDFVGRQYYLDQLLTKLNPRKFASSCPWLALEGLGGVGKTQISLQFAFEVRKSFPECSVFWVQANDASSFDNSYRRIARVLDVPGVNKANADVKALVCQALAESPDPWLVIVDNADDYNVLSTPGSGNSSRPLLDYIPTYGEGAVLFTTRDGKSATKFAESNVIHVQAMNNEESRQLLANSIQIHKRDLLNDESSVVRLLNLLLHLPLAIKQAASYMNENSTPISEYLSFYDKSEQDMIEALSKDFGDRGRYRTQKNPVATTWLVSFDQIRRLDQLAAQYLSFIGVIARENIPLSLLHQEPSPLRRNEAIGTLVAYSFITQRSGEAAFDVHRLVHLATRNWLEEENEMFMWSNNALHALSKALPEDDFSNREVWTAYLPHAVYLTDTIRISSENEFLVIKLLDQIGRCYYDIGRYIGSEQAHRKTLELRQRVCGPEHHDTLISMNELGLALKSQGKYAEAEVIYRQTLALREKLYGEEHLATLIIRDNLGGALYSQGEYERAEALYRTTLLLWEKVAGAEDSHTLMCMSNLGAVLSAQGKREEAEEMHQKTLAIRETALGKEHPDTLTSRMWVASMLSYRAKFVEAEEQYRSILETHERVLGKEHPSTLRSMNNLGAALSGQDRYNEAEDVFRKTFELRTKVLGSDHPETLNTKNLLEEVQLNRPVRFTGLNH